MNLPPCPHCGVTDEVFTNVRAFGWCEKHYDVDGTSLGIETDRLQFTDSKRIRCSSCLKVRRDVILQRRGYEDVVVPKVP